MLKKSFFFKIVHLLYLVLHILFYLLPGRHNINPQNMKNNYFACFTGKNSIVGLLKR